ncbi:hypothetical protein [Actinoplanes sp. NBRC 101535]|uniref:hypothetical protein n=1 Tax=Actinoplanes sp. NBRC 101535 TaxID=3032196 RepID=UPI0024A36267|nr:hypothetical protein [Actinoplanes sp. NBRC 101535]GLY05967.1 hypothetical protein Acsp01_63460 [Actinoplanes sp. NBRC 101535]
MDDLDRLLAESMHTAADRAPSESGLLGSVHDRSHRYHRRRVVTGWAAAAVAALAIGVPFAVTNTDTPAPVPAADTLVAGWTAPVFPFTLPQTADRKTPVATMVDGDLIGFFETTDYDEADVTITVADSAPVFTGEATTRDMTVRGHKGTLRTVNTKPAKRLTLTWQESAGTWILLETDDTYKPKDVVALADAMTAASIAVQPPFRLDLTPAGLQTDTVTASRMTFRTASGTTVLRTILRKRQTLTGVDQKVNGYDAALTRDAAGVTLAIDVTDWQATLEVTVDAAFPITDADLLRYATGVHLLNRSDPE